MEINTFGPLSALAAVIRAERARRRWSEQDLADRADIPYGTLRKYLSATPRPIDLSQLSRIAAAFGMRLSELVALIEDEMGTSGLPDRRKYPQTRNVLDSILDDVPEDDDPEGPR
jgi:transcriptional regulator with XRE-family HTH domain